MADAPLVGIAVEGVTTFGRSVLRGVLRYANLRRTWVLHKDIWRVTGGSVHWPDCDGTIIAGVLADIYDDVLAHSRHVVSCSGSFYGNMPVVCLDDHATAAMAAEHLFDRGLRQFAYFGPSLGSQYEPSDGRPRPTAARRARGFHQTLAKHGFSCTDYGVEPWPSYEDLLTHAHHPALIRWIQALPKPIGILAFDDMAASDLAEACREANVGVPDRVAIIGINNDDLLCESALPPLSSVEVDFARMGYEAAKVLDRLLHGEKLEPAEMLVELPPIRVHQRMSTDILAIDEPDVADAIRYIRAHACDPCTVRDVLAAVPVNRRTLERRFATGIGRSLHDEIARVRVDTARRMLVQPDLTIYDIAERCGFSSHTSFNRFFEDQTGVTPAAFRRQSIRGSRPLDAGKKTLE